MAGTWRWTVAIATLVAITGGARVADAGRTHYGWVRGTEVLPERSVEIETWVLERNGLGDGDAADPPDETVAWWWTVVGITDQLELAIPIAVRHQDDDAGGQTALLGYGAELRWRLVSSDPVEGGRIAPVVRLGVQRLVNQRDRVRSDGGIAVGADLGSRIHAAVDVGGIWIAGDGRSTFQIAPAAGLSVRIVDELRVGAEVYAEAALRGPGPDWLAAGPNLAWTYGRFWLSASLPIGIIDASTAPRLNWAVAF
ncbi:MAG TPA: hypothetical protein VK698_32065 [Kofleriaceae bacterium]|nr:hypothetical protein [Kofleriaceae bacterium]